MTPSCGGGKRFEAVLLEPKNLARLRLWYAAVALVGGMDPWRMTNLEAQALSRLHALYQGRQDPLVVKREEDRFAQELEAEEAWEAALPGGEGYEGPRGTFPYGRG